MNGETNIDNMKAMRLHLETSFQLILTKSQENVKSELKFPPIKRVLLSKASRQHWKQQHVWHQQEEGQCEN